MAIRYYFSGFDKERGFTQEIANLLKQDIQKTNKLVYIPTDFLLKEKIEAYFKGFTLHFKKIGLHFSNLVVLDETMSKEEMQTHITGADVVYLMGGNPNSQLKILEDYCLFDSISKADVVIGLSAGAMCMSKYSLSLPVSDEYPSMDIRQGMNLSGISIYPHYNTDGLVVDMFDRGKEQTKKTDILEANRKCGDFYLMSDDSAIRDANGDLTFIGTGFILVSDGKFSNT